MPIDLKGMQQPRHQRGKWASDQFTRRQRRARNRRMTGKSLAIVATVAMTVLIVAVQFMRQ